MVEIQRKNVQSALPATLEDLSDTFCSKSLWKGENTHTIKFKHWFISLAIGMPLGHCAVAVLWIWGRGLIPGVKVERAGLGVGHWLYVGVFPCSYT